MAIRGRPYVPGEFQEGHDGGFYTARSGRYDTTG
jgi:hypothetical protein